MQTLPSFVYLIPAVTFFSIGLVPGVVTTIIFALPPGVRLTELGIRQVDRETVEAGHAFGSSPWQILRGIELPLTKKNPYSIDENLWGRSIEGGRLEEPNYEPPEEIFQMTVSPENRRL